MDFGTDTWQALLGIGVGIALSATCGFRVFLPLLAVSIASHLGYLPLAPGFEWLGDPMVMAALSVATVCEIGAYYIPWLDHALDTVATPAAVTAGVLVAASQITDLPPGVKWAVAIIAGGGAAGSTQLFTVGLRALSTATTGGLGNFLFSTLEWIAALVVCLVVIVFPIVAAVVLISIGYVVWRVVKKFGGGKPAAAPV